jgi:hypothetical protein
MANVNTGAMSCGTFPSHKVVRFMVTYGLGDHGLKISDVPIATEIDDRVRKRVAASSSLTRDRRKRLDTREVRPASFMAFIEPSIEVVIPSEDQHTVFTHLNTSPPLETHQSWPEPFRPNEAGTKQYNQRTTQ